MIICAHCSKEMSIHDMMDIGIPVLIHDANGEPYEIVYGDRVHCPSCGASVLTGFGKPTKRHDEGFETALPGVKAAEWTVKVY